MDAILVIIKNSNQDMLLSLFSDGNSDASDKTVYKRKVTKTNVIC